ncbi:hypothetical protein [Mesobacterium hydrothermale]|uniref:hypothetical protein n=1 Tax=Mesobacterium hydrothermale TaxID=3111907 RepID=UPI002DBA5AD0|nr:hypothetical protein [Mesobacterium sp. TK19101]
MNKGYTGKSWDVNAKWERMALHIAPQAGLKQLLVPDPHPSTLIVDRLKTKNTKYG